jgi:hypothetical protein
VAAFFESGAAGSHFGDLMADCGPDLAFRRLLKKSTPRRMEFFAGTISVE